MPFRCGAARLRQNRPPRKSEVSLPATRRSWLYEFGVAEPGLWPVPGHGGAIRSGPPTWEGRASLVFQETGEPAFNRQPGSIACWRADRLWRACGLPGMACRLRPCAEVVTSHAVWLGDGVAWGLRRTDGGRWPFPNALCSDTGLKGAEISQPLPEGVRSDQGDGARHPLARVSGRHSPCSWSCHRCPYRISGGWREWRSGLGKRRPWRRRKRWRRSRWC